MRRRGSDIARGGSPLGEEAKGRHEDLGDGLCAEGIVAVTSVYHRRAVPSVARGPWQVFSLNYGYI